MNMHFRLADFYLSVLWVIKAYWTYVCRRRWPEENKVVRANTIGEPSIDQDSLARSIREAPENATFKVDRSGRATSSNSMRSTSFDMTTGVHILRLGVADQILYIDTAQSEVVVEPGVTMEQLVDALLPHRLVPFVVPEFKALTVGGVLAGAGIESSSWSHGQFGDHLLEAQYLLSNGTVVSCSPSSHSDLFYGALGACGTLGLLTKARIKVRRIITPFVELHCEHVSTTTSIASLQVRMKQMKLSQKPTGFLDAIVYDDQTCIISAIPNHPGPRTHSFSRGRDPWFFKYAQESTEQYAVIHIKDYFFRYDAGAFWMAQYAISPFLDLQLFLQEVLPPVTDQYTGKLLSLLPFGGYNKFSRWLLSPLLSTNAMYTRLHQAPIEDIADTLVIQDVYIPLSAAAEFLDFLRYELGTEKIWLCPMKCTQTAQIFSPHYCDTNSSQTVDSSDFINFGIWCHKSAWQPSTTYARTMTRKIEDKVYEVGGRKMLYSLSHYSRKSWNEIYNAIDYAQLKQKWDPHQAWGDIYDKVGKPLPTRS